MKKVLQHIVIILLMLLMGVSMASGKPPRSIEQRVVQDFLANSDSYLKKKPKYKRLIRANSEYIRDFVREQLTSSSDTIYVFVVVTYVESDDFGVICGDSLLWLGEVLNSNPRVFSSVKRHAVTDVFDQQYVSLLSHWDTAYMSSQSQITIGTEDYHVVRLIYQDNDLLSADTVTHPFLLEMDSWLKEYYNVQDNNELMHVVIE